MCDQHTHTHSDRAQSLYVVFARLVECWGGGEDVVYVFTWGEEKAIVGFAW